MLDFFFFLLLDTNLNQSIWGEMTEIPKNLVVEWLFVWSALVCTLPPFLIPHVHAESLAIILWLCCFLTLPTQIAHKCICEKKNYIYIKWRKNREMKTWQKVVLSACSAWYLNRPWKADRSILLMYLRTGETEKWCLDNAHRNAVIQTCKYTNYFSFSSTQVAMSPIPDATADSSVPKPSEKLHPKYIISWHYIHICYTELSKIVLGISQ